MLCGVRIYKLKFFVSPSRCRCFLSFDWCAGMVQWMYLPSQDQPFLRWNFHGVFSAWKGSRKMIDPSSESPIQCVNKQWTSSEFPVVIGRGDTSGYKEGLLTIKGMRIVCIRFAVRKNPWSISFGGANRLSSLILFQDPESYYIELSIVVLPWIYRRGTRGFLAVKKWSFQRRRRRKFLWNIGETFMAISRPGKAAASSESSVHCLNKNCHASFRL